MSPRYMEALCEVEYVLKVLEPEELEKIPQSFKDFISKHKDKRYEVSSMENLREETLSLLAIIYTKFLADPEERIILEKEYREKLKREKEELRNKKQNSEINYAPKVINQDNTPKKESEKLIVAVSQCREKKWYEKIADKIKNILKIKQ